MTIIVFLVDTSASMQQKAFVSGRSALLDVAKGAVEFFVKTRQKSPESRRVNKATWSNRKSPGCVIFWRQSHPAVDPYSN